MQTVCAAAVRKLRSDSLSRRILSVKPFPEYLLHRRNIPGIAHQHVNLHNVRERQPNQRQPCFHVIQRAVNLCFGALPHIADAEGQINPFACSDNLGISVFVCLLLIQVQPGNFVHMIAPFTSIVPW